MFWFYRSRPTHFGRQGKALTNFQETLPQPQSDLAQQIIKDLTILIS